MWARHLAFQKALLGEHLVPLANGTTVRGVEACGGVVVRCVCVCLCVCENERGGELIAGLQNVLSQTKFISLKKRRQVLLIL